MSPPPPPSPPATHPPQPFKSVSPQTIQAALKTLKKQITTNLTPPSSSDPIFLVITLKKAPSSKGPTRAHTIPLPYPPPPFSSNNLCCLILNDGPTLLELKKRAADERMVLVSRLIGVSELKDELDGGNEARRRLCDQFDMFFVEKGVSDVVKGLLGKCFYKKKKVPVPVEMRGVEWKKEIERVLGSAMLFLGNGTCSTVKVGRVGMEEDEVVENVVEVGDRVVEVVGGWNEVRSLHLKLSWSVAVPVYQDVVAGGAAKRREDGKGNGKKKNKKKGKEGKGGKASKRVNADEFSGKKSEEEWEKGSDDDDGRDVMVSGVDELMGAKFSGEFGKKKRKRGSKGDDKPDNVYERDDKISDKKIKKRGSKKKRIHEIQYMDTGAVESVGGHDIGSNNPGEGEKNKKKDKATFEIRGDQRKKSKDQAKRPSKTKQEKAIKQKKLRSL
ncbi:hypothetical protein Droror1_Dr00007963 [Drosera rotundifolia]